MPFNKELGQYTHWTESGLLAHLTLHAEHKYITFV